MSHTTELDIYRYKSQLDLCLYLIEEALKDSQKGHHDLVNERLEDILEVFDRDTSSIKSADKSRCIMNNISLIAAND